MPYRFSSYMMHAYGFAYVSRNSFTGTERLSMKLYYKYGTSSVVTIVVNESRRGNSVSVLCYRYPNQYRGNFDRSSFGPIDDGAKKIIELLKYLTYPSRTAL